MSLKISLVISCLLLSSFLFAQNEAEIEQLSAKVGSLYAQGYYEEAIPYAQKVVELTSSKQDTNHAEALTNLGTMCLEIGYYEEAEEHYTKALVLEEKFRGKEHPAITSILNDMAILYETLGQYEKAEDLYKKVLRLDKKQLGAEHPDVSITMGNLAFLYDAIGQYDEAEALYLEALAIQKKAYGEEDPQIALTMGNLALLYQNQGLYDKAEALQLKGLAIEKALLGEYHPDVAVSIGNLANLYQTTSNFSKARELYLECLRIMEKIPGENRLEMARLYNNLAALDNHSHNYSQARIYFEKSLAYQEEILGKMHPNIAISIGHIGLTYQNQGQFKEAEVLFLKAHNMLKSILGDAHPSVSTTLGNLAFFYFKSGEFDKSEAYYLKAIEVKRQAFGPGHPELARIQNGLGLFYNKTNQPQKALAILAEAIASNSNIPVDATNLPKSIQKIIEENAFKDFSIATLNLTELSLTKQGLYKSTKDIKELKEAFVFLECLTQHLQSTSMQLTNVNDKLRLLENASDCAENGIRVATVLYEKTKEEKYLKACISFAEYNKSAILSSVLQSESALTFGGVPDSLVNKEHLIQEQLDQLKKDLIEASSANDSAMISELKSIVVETSLAQDAFRKDLEKNYPKYSQLKYQATNITTEAIQKDLLDPSSALIEYFIYDSSTYIIAITKDDIQVYNIQIQARSIELLRKSLSDPKFITEHPKKAFAQYSAAAFSLYQELIVPVEEQLKGIDKLIIIPDNVLGHIPFEALLTKAPGQSDKNYQTLPYLIQKYRISYSYSAALLLENQRNKQKSNNGRLLAFAASYNSEQDADEVLRSPQHFALRKVLAPLPAAKKEVHEIQLSFPNGAFYLGQQATESVFKKQAGDFAVLHMAMHGVLNPKHPLLSSLAFSEDRDSLEDNFLEAHEISNLQLNNDLVVLSACETGFGKFEQGEGVISLARSFMYAGVPSLVVSLWQVNDQSTSLIMKFFYQNLSEGMAKDEALRQAKLYYIEHAKGIAAHPAFWSAFIQIGDSSPIQIKKGGAWLFYGGIGGLLLVGIIFFLIRKNRKAESV